MKNILRILLLVLPAMACAMEEQKDNNLLQQLSVQRTMHALVDNVYWADIQNVLQAIKEPLSEMFDVNMIMMSDMRESEKEQLSISHKVLRDGPNKQLLQAQFPIIAQLMISKLCAIEPNGSIERITKDILIPLIQRLKNAIEVYDNHQEIAAAYYAFHDLFIKFGGKKLIAKVQEQEEVADMLYQLEDKVDQHIEREKFVLSKKQDRCFVSQYDELSDKQLEIVSGIVKEQRDKNDKCLRAIEKEDQNQQDVHAAMEDLVQQVDQKDALRIEEFKNMYQRVARKAAGVAQQKIAVAKAALKAQNEKEAQQAKELQRQQQKSLDVLRRSESCNAQPQKELQQLNDRKKALEKIIDDSENLFEADSHIATISSRCIDRAKKLLKYVDNNNQRSSIKNFIDITANELNIFEKNIKKHKGKNIKEQHEKDAKQATQLLQKTIDFNAHIIAYAQELLNALTASATGQVTPFKEQQQTASASSSAVSDQKEDEIQKDQDISEVKFHEKELPDSDADELKISIHTDPAQTLLELSRLASAAQVPAVASAALKLEMQSQATSSGFVDNAQNARIESLQNIIQASRDFSNDGAAPDILAQRTIGLTQQLKPLLDDYYQGELDKCLTPAQHAYDQFKKIHEDSKKKKQEDMYALGLQAMLYTMPMTNAVISLNSSIELLATRALRKIQYPRSEEKNGLKKIMGDLLKYYNKCTDIKKFNELVEFAKQMTPYLQGESKDWFVAGFLDSMKDQIKKLNEKNAETIKVQANNFIDVANGILKVMYSGFNDGASDEEVAGSVERIIKTISEIAAKSAKK